MRGVTGRDLVDSILERGAGEQSRCGELRQDLGQHGWIPGRARNYEDRRTVWRARFVTGTAFSFASANVAPLKLMCMTIKVRFRSCQIPDCATVSNTAFSAERDRGCVGAGGGGAGHFDPQRRREDRSAAQHIEALVDGARRSSLTGHRLDCSRRASMKCRFRRRLEMPLRNNFRV